jgi:nucleotide-binding universal stress UspA family protein
MLMGALRPFRTVAVPFDFSPVAHTAAEHAAALAAGFKANLVFWVVYDKYSREKLETNEAEVFRRTAAAKLEALGTRYIKEFGVRIGYEWLEGKIQRSVEMKCEGEDSLILVVGTMGDKHQDVLFQSSNANRLTLKVKHPVLAIQENNKYTPYRRILLAIDPDNFNTREKIPYAVQMASAHRAEVQIIGLEKHHDRESVGHLRALVAQAEKYFLHREIPFRSELRPVRSKNTDTLSIAKELNVDVLVVMAESEGPFGGLWGSNFPNYLLQHFEGPVLIVPPKVSTVTSKVSI